MSTVETAPAHWPDPGLPQIPRPVHVLLEVALPALSQGASWVGDTQKPLSIKYVQVYFLIAPRKATEWVNKVSITQISLSFFFLQKFSPSINPFTVVWLRYLQKISFLLIKVIMAAFLWDTFLMSKRIYEFALPTGLFSQINAITWPFGACLSF